MALVLKDRVRAQTVITGTADILFSASISGYQPFSVIGNGNSTFYTITDSVNWEVGVGTYTTSTNTLTRGTVLASSNSGNKVVFTSGIKDVFVTYPAEKSVNFDVNDNVGLGTAEPSSKLQIVGTSGGYNVTPQLRIGQDGSNLSIAKQMLIGYDTTNSRGFIQALQWNTANSPLVIQPAGGNVGIGVSSPAQKLDVAGAVKTTGGVIPRVTESTTYSSWDSSTTDVVSITTQNVAMTVGADAGGATAVNGQKITFRIVASGSSCTVTFSSGSNYTFKGIGVTLPSTKAVANGETLMVGAIYNTNSLRWEVVALTQG